ncbi:MAG: putative xylitol transport system permease protein [Gammaproteobacteria bacterium]|jgi:ribose/xylose/arabinose/galactoside ABC-type transport system permease subunit|nr:putative xylitol transport system permease protein [Gammaproteobacteria bacterium]
MRAPGTLGRVVTALRKRRQDTVLPVLIALIAILAGIIEPRFWTVDNLLNLARQMVPLLVVSVGQAFAVISGGLDLSLAAIISLGGVGGILTMNRFGIASGIGCMLLIGVGTGLLSGSIIAYFRTTPLVVTLGMLSVAQACALILSNGTPIYDVPAPYAELVGFDSIAGLPWSVWIGIATTLGGGFLLRHTVFGRYVYAIGSNASAATKSGVDVPLYTMLVYGLSGLCAAIAAVVLTAWVGSAQPVAAADITLQSVAAVVLGGVALTGGRGSMLQVIYGVTMLSMLSNVMNMIGVSAYYQTLVIGFVIILAVILDRLRRGRYA